MKQEINNITETRKEIIVTISSAEFKQAEREVFAEFSKHAQLPGFRAGKAPEAIIRKKFADKIDAELQKRITSNAYNDIINNKEIKIFNIVDIKDPTITKDQDTPITFIVDTWPDFNLPEYEKIEVKKEDIKITKEEIQAAIEKMREQMAEYNTVERPAKEGDYIRVSYEGTVNGTPIAEIAPNNPIYSKQDRTWEQAGPGDDEEFSISSISNALVGMSANDSKEVTHKFPKVFKIDPLADKEANYKIAVHEVKEKVLPEVDNAFLKRVAAENMEQLHKKVEEDFIRSKEQKNVYSIREQVLKALEAEPEFPLPQASLEDEKNRAVYSILQKKMQEGASEEELQKEKSAIEEDGLARAKTALKARLILTKIAEKEKIEVDNQDIYNELLKQSYMTRKPIEELIKHIKKDRSALSAVQQEALFYKTLDFLGKKASIVIEESKK